MYEDKDKNKAIKRGGTVVNDAGTDGNVATGGNGAGGNGTGGTDTAGTGGIYSKFTGNNYSDVEKYLQSQIAAYKPETEEQRKKREKREKREKFLANVADVLGAFHKGYSYQRGVRPMDLPNMSERARARLEKAKAEREKERDRIYNYAFTLGKIKDAQKDFNFRAAQADQQQQNWQKNYDAARQDAADTKDFRNRQFDAARQDHTDAMRQWERSFAENQRQFNARSAQEWRSLSLQAARLQAEKDNNSATYTLGEGDGKVTVPRAAINAQNMAAVYGTLPQEYQIATPAEYVGADGKIVSGLPSTEDMTVAIGVFLGNPNIDASVKSKARAALKRLGKFDSSGLTMPGVGGGSKMPGVK